MAKDQDNNQEMSSDVKLIIDFFGDQFNDSINRLQDSNDRAHEALFSKIDTMTRDVSEISASVKVIIRNEEEHRKKVADLEGVVGNLSDRLTIMEDENEKNKHFWSRLKNNFTTVGVIAGALYAVWKIVEFVVL